MSSDIDRIPVPTNGSGPKRVKPKASQAAKATQTAKATQAAKASPAAKATRAAKPTAAAPPDAVHADAGGDAPEPTSADFSVAFSPKQVAVGFGIIASLILLVVGARRRGKGR